jgi:hypothetical protein
MFIDGFDQFAGYQQNLTVQVRAAGYACSGNLAVSLGRDRSSIHAAALFALKKGDTVERTHAWSGRYFSTGLAAKSENHGTLLWVVTPAGRVTLWVSPDDGQPRLNDRIGDPTLARNVWYYYELVADRATRTITLIVNGVPDVPIPMPAGMELEAAVTVGFGAAESSTYGSTINMMDAGARHFDDFYMRDGGQLGPVVIRTRFPGALVEPSSDNLWRTPNGPGKNALNLNQHPPKVAELFNMSDEIGNVDAFWGDEALANENPVLATALVALVRKANSFDARLGMFLGSESTASPRSGIHAPDNTWRTYYSCFEPVGSDTAKKIKDAPFGLSVVAP